MDSSNKKGKFLGVDYIDSMKSHYPQFIEGDAQSEIDGNLKIGFIDRWCDQLDQVGVDSSNRFVPLDERPWNYERSAWAESSGRDLRTLGARGAYKGLINLKPSIDLVLYSNLIWEMAPKTIIEFGSLQGGSALWFADQLDSAHNQGEVHSFELCYKCIHPSATHPRLTFHETDLNDISSLDADLFKNLPHPWLVVDDAHTNLRNLVPFVSQFMTSGDYYIIEDVFLTPRSDMISSAIEICNSLGFLVDTKYTDAFGTNVTCSLNGWLVKT